MNLNPHPQPSLRSGEASQRSRDLTVEVHQIRAKREEPHTACQQVFLDVLFQVPLHQMSVRNPSFSVAVAQLWNTFLGYGPFAPTSLSFRYYAKSFL